MVHGISPTTTKAIERAVEEVESRQPRFNQDAKSFISNLYMADRFVCDQVPPYASDSRRRDKWLVQSSMNESHLISTIQQAVALDTNRGWEMIGGRNQVRRFTNILKNEYYLAPGSGGYRKSIAADARAFYTTDLGSTTEIGRGGSGDGPLASLLHLDPTRCKLTGDMEYPLEYYPKGGNPQKWESSDYMLNTSLPDIREEFNGLGFCAVSRCLQLALTMQALVMHDQEMLAARAPTGLLLVTGISEGQWTNAMERRNADLTRKERQYFGGISVLANSGMDSIDAKLVALSQMPTNMSHKEWTDLLMYGYALSFGYDPSEFWPVQFGSLGRGEEALVQHEKATDKGNLSFALSWQDNFQRELPPTLLFQFQERDDRGAQLDAETNQKRADFIKTMADTRINEQAVLANWQVMELWAKEELIPSEWTQGIDETISDDEGEVREQVYRQKMLERSEIRRACEMFPEEPIIRYIWRPGLDTEQIIWRSGNEALRRKSYPIGQIARQDDTNNVLYESEDVIITEEDVDRAIEETEDQETQALMIAETIE